jgi:hypothetical protein
VTEDLQRERSLPVSPPLVHSLHQVQGRWGPAEVSGSSPWNSGPGSLHGEHSQSEVLWVEPGGHANGPGEQVEGYRLGKGLWVGGGVQRTERADGGVSSVRLVHTARGVWALVCTHTSCRRVASTCERARSRVSA